MKVFFIGNGKMIREISKLKEISCVGIYDKNLYILLEKPDIIIDFSHPDFLEKSVEKALELNVPLLVGTTGYNNKQMAYLKDNSRKIPILYSANFSKALILLKQFLNQNLKHFKNYDSHIYETHHIHKKDTPSGTSIYLASALNNCQISSFRSGEVYGIHEVMLENNEEKITLRHEVLSKELFVKGVYEAAIILLQKPKGFYTYEDILNEKNGN